jgi:molybdopterin-guanine dinucleotide biosynthesis protein A
VVNDSSKQQVLLDGSMEPLPIPVTALILCGGRSKRMGRPKAFLPFAGKTIIEHLLSLTRQIFDESLLVSNEPETVSHLDVDVVKDILPYRGPLGGILSGLLVSRNEHVFVIACDMPLINRRLLRSLAAQRHNTDVVVLTHDAGVEPLLGVYSKACIKPLEESLFAGRLKVHDFLAGLKAKTWEYKETQAESGELPAHFNVNTPQDYALLL